MSLTQKHPGFIYENFISGYDNINWMQSLKLVENKSIDLKISNSVFGNINFNHSIIDNFFYVSTDQDSQEIMVPILNQYGGKIKHSSLKFLISAKSDFLKLLEKLYDLKFYIYKFSILHLCVSQNLCSLKL